MNYFSKKSTINNRRSRQHRPSRQRRLHLEQLEGRRLFAGDVGHDMDHATDNSHVSVTDTAVIVHWDKVPRFGANPTNTAIENGLWSNPATWSTGAIPSQDEIVSIPEGVSVVYDVHSQLKLDVIEVSGRLDFATDVDTSLWLNELMVMPSGTLTIGTAENPIAAAVSAEIVITDTPGADGKHFKTGTVAEPGIDPQQWGNGLIGFGTIEIYGQEKTSSYIRLANEPLAGDRVLVLESEPLNWQPGDELVLPDTQSDWNRSRVEELIIQSVDGNRVTLTEPLKFNHRGPRATAGGDPLVLPHIGNLSRNIVLRSENPEGVRGHVAFLGRADVEVSYARFKDLGRTTTAPLDETTFAADGSVTHIGANPQARYALHFHHTIGPENPEDSGYQFEVTGNAIDGALRWGVVVHGSHYGLINENFAYNYQGAGFVTENGQESYNRFEGNFAVLSNGDGKNFKLGNAGEGFWFRSPLTESVNNVAANAQRAGFNYFVQNLHGANQANWPKPAFRGADLMQTSETIPYNVFEAPILHFEGNEVYASGAVFDNWQSVPDDKQYLTGLTGWNTSRSMFSLSSYANENLVVDGLKLIGDLSRVTPGTRQGYQPISRVGIEAVRSSDNVNVRNSEIRGVQVGFETPSFGPDATSAGKRDHEIIIADSVIQAYVGVQVNTMTRASNLGREVDYARLVIENTRFERMPENSVEPEQYAVYLQFAMNSDITKTNEIFIFDFNGVPGANYRVYYPEQAPNYIMTQSDGKKIIGAPVAGLTNAEAWNRYGIAIAGAVAPTREYDGDNGEAALARGRALGIHGLVFPLDGAAVLNQAPTVSAGKELTVQQHRQVPLVGQVSDDGRATGAAGGQVHVDWSKQSGPGEVLFSDNASAQTSALFTEPGTYRLRLTASDGMRESYDVVTVHVLPADNRAPVVNAGNNLVLNDSNSVMLTGRVADDGRPAGTLTTQWSVVSGPGTVRLADPAQPTTQATFTAKGIYVLELRADDGELVTTDQVVVTVNHASPVSPLLVQLEMNDARASDSSQHELHSETLGTTLTTGRFGSALHFSEGSYVALPRTDFLQPQTGLTAALWVRPDVVDGIERPILVWDGGSWDAYQISLTNRPSGAEILGGVATNGNQRLKITTESLPTDQWTHLALTFSQDHGGEIRLYRNGELIGLQQGIGTSLGYKPHADNRLTLGKENPNSGGATFIGSMDELFVYDYALSGYDLEHLMMGHAPHTGTAPTPPHHQGHMAVAPEIHPITGLSSAPASPIEEVDHLLATIDFLLEADPVLGQNSHDSHQGQTTSLVPADSFTSLDKRDPSDTDLALSSDIEMNDWQKLF